MEKNKAEIEKIILIFLREHGENYFTCALATCWDNQPRNTPVDARNDGLVMYFSADPGGKLENIRRNPNVCLAVFMPLGKGASPLEVNHQLQPGMKATNIKITRKYQSTFLPMARSRRTEIKVQTPYIMRCISRE